MAEGLRKVPQKVTAGGIDLFGEDPNWVTPRCTIQSPASAVDLLLRDAVADHRWWVGVIEFEDAAVETGPDDPSMVRDESMTMLW